jgi:hypothetical protein
MSVELDFEEELRLLLDQWDAVDMFTERLRARLDGIGGVEAAKEYVRLETGGLGEAYRRLSARQTLEGLILRYAELFDTETLRLAEAKLDSLAEPEESAE